MAEVENTHPGGGVSLAISGKGASVGRPIAKRRFGAGDHSVGGSLVNDLAVAGCRQDELFVLAVDSGPGGQSSAQLRVVGDGLWRDGALLEPGTVVPLAGHVRVETDVHVFDLEGGTPPALPAPAAGGRRVSQAHGGSVHGAVVAVLNERRSTVTGLAVLAGLFALAGIGTLMMRTLPTAFPGLVSAQTPVADGTMRARLLALLAGSDLSHLVTVEERSGQLVVVGALTEDQAARLRIAVAAFNAGEGDASPVRLAVRFRDDAEHGLVGIIRSPRKYVIDAQGTLVAEGGVLKSRWRVDQIDASGVILSRDGRRLAVADRDSRLITGSIAPASAALSPTPMRGTLNGS